MTGPFQYNLDDKRPTSVDEDSPYQAPSCNELGLVGYQLHAFGVHTKTPAGCECPWEIPIE